MIVFHLSFLICHFLIHGGSQYRPRERMDPTSNEDMSKAFALTHLLTQVVLTTLPRRAMQMTK